MIARWLERDGGTATAVAAPPEGYDILIIAEKFGVLPDDVENRMSEWWFSRAMEWITGDSIATKNRMKSPRTTHGRK